jgi:hypothetical protein
MIEIIALVEKNKLLQAQMDLMLKKFELVEKLVRFDF